MCGIVGMLGLNQNGIDDGDVQLFQQLLVIDTLRGLDGTGIISIDNKQRCSAFKIASDPFTLLRADNVQQSIHGHKKRHINALIGHNRAATRGDKDTECAHPFTRGKITLVHNGTLMNGHELPDFHKFKVDSDALCSAIDKLGIRAVVDKRPGAYAIVYYDNDNKTLNFLRNEERPLWWCKFWGEKSFAWASEPEFLEVVLRRRYKEIGAITQMQPNMLTTVHMKTGQITMVSMAPKFTTYFGVYHNPPYRGPVAGSNFGRRIENDHPEYNDTDSEMHTIFDVDQSENTGHTLLRANRRNRPGALNPQTTTIDGEGNIIEEKKTTEVITNPPRKELAQIKSMIAQRRGEKLGITKPSNVVALLTSAAIIQQASNMQEEAKQVIVHGNGRSTFMTNSYSGYTKGQEIVFEVIDQRPSEFSKEGKEKRWNIIGIREDIKKTNIVSVGLDSNESEYFNLCGIVKGKILNIMKDVTEKDEAKQFYLIYVGDLQEVAHHNDSYDKDGLRRYRTHIDEIMEASKQGSTVH